MLLHERHHEPSDALRQGPPSGGPSNVDRLRQEGESLLRAAGQAIDRALSADSQAFLEATRQDGGQ